ncbi:hypothetical protein VCRA2110O407_190045 [Vibrio crassostreae]|nr:hypothetical protein VCRA2113O414_210045 [Vibrio crassostreae]CAK2158894.1 hypothetical protein VCRA2118O429_70045 [Vibrio crassostreae]CAK2429702.1 hypothetical protein VCRA2110O407_190045 [Vibrio crassostreae]CAK3832205.1 hypothetical protein VCRA2121O442_200045 [Vibrio crassostreae]
MMFNRPFLVRKRNASKSQADFADATPVATRNGEYQLDLVTPNQDVGCERGRDLQRQLNQVA